MITKRTLSVLLLGALAVSLPQPSDAQTWQQTNGPYGGDVRCIALSAVEDLFIGTQGGGVLRSTDNGDTWEAVNNGITAKDVWAIHVAANDNVFAGTMGGGVFRSDDNGDSWTQVNNGLEWPFVISLATNS